METWGTHFMDRCELRLEMSNETQQVREMISPYICEMEMLDYIPAIVFPYVDIIFLTSLTIPNI